jgi:hypothetical protein
MERLTLASSDLVKQLLQRNSPEYGLNVTALLLHFEHFFNMISPILDNIMLGRV